MSDPRDLDPSALDAWPEYDPEPTVLLSCCWEHAPQSEVTFLDIAEDPQGRDVLTFVCPRCHRYHTSHIFGW
jgi:hypothetical protein